MPRRRRRMLGPSRRAASLLARAATVGVFAAVAFPLAVTAPVAAQQAATQPQASDPNQPTDPGSTSDRLAIGGDRASSWVDPTGARVLLIEGGVTIRSDDAAISADRAVVWLTPAAAGSDAAGGYSVSVALFGNAKVVRGDVTRAGGELFVTLATRPDVRLDVANLDARDRRTEVRYLQAYRLRRQAQRGELPVPYDITPGQWASSQPVYGPSATQPASTEPASTEPSTQPVTAMAPSKRGTLSYSADRLQTPMTPDGRVAIVLSGNVQIVETKGDGSRLELQSQNAVLFTNYTEPRQMYEHGVNASRDFDACYLEDDVRIAMTPPEAKLLKSPEQSLRAARCVYEFSSDRAILTDALMHSLGPTDPAPLVVRAREMRKLGTDSYEADHATLTTSDFRVPSLSLAASKVTIRQSETADARTTTSFVAYNATPRIYGAPVFWFPRLFGSITDGELPLRQILLSQSTGFGFGVSTQWGLFQTLGVLPPEGVDASYRLEYYTNRGPAAGFDTSYAGGTINETTRQPFSFDGSFTSYAVLDNGEDRLGRYRKKPQFDGDVRGRVRWDHQQFLGDGWQVQAQAAYVSDPTFLEEWFRNEFRNGLEQDSTLNIRRTSGNEVFGVLATANFSDVPTTADQLQEVTLQPSPSANPDFAPITVERLPEVYYDKLGQSFGDDRFTLVSTNSVAGLHFNKSYATLNDDFGFRNSSKTPGTDDSFVGIPSYGYTGYTGNYVGRGDFRQEVAMPMGDDRVRVTPFTVLRYTAWSDSPSGDTQQRLLAGVGVRTSTEFSRVYDNVHSELFDVHRMRHIIEPQMSLFASAQTQDRNDVFIYDEGVDGITDVVGGQLAVRQRFQTKRGGEGFYRSVDFLTLDTGVNYFANQESEPTSPDPTSDIVTADAFRGVYYGAMPEASIPRSTLFADGQWRVTDTTAVLGDVAWNLDHQDLATAAVGLSVSRDPRVSYFAGVRYIGEMNSTIATISFDYQISERYSIALNQSFNLSEGQNQSTSMELVRRFEQFYVRFTIYFDQIEDEGGIQLSIAPRNLPFGTSVGNGVPGRS